MKTEIIIKKGWEIIYTHNCIFSMSKGDIVEYEGIEFKVDCCFFEVEKQKMLILLKYFYETNRQTTPKYCKWN